MKIPTSIWGDPSWRNLTPSAQLMALVCMSFGRSGLRSDARIARRANLTRETIAAARIELAQSPYAHVLEGTTKRRRMPARIARAVFARDNNKCKHCGTSERLTVDHIFPVSRGGGDEMSNLQALCHSCNARKGARVG